MSKIRVAVLRGGPSSQYDISLKTGGAVLKNLPSKYFGEDILITKDGIWHKGGIPKNPENILKHVDVVFNALHGYYGEDGKVQKFLETHGIPFTGSKALSSAFSMNKVLAKKIFKKEGIKPPFHFLVSRGEDLKEVVSDIFIRLPLPILVKPVSSGHSFGVSLAHSILELENALVEAFKHGEKALVEEYISGKDISCVVLDHWRGAENSALFPVEILKHSDLKFFDQKAKQDKKTRKISPSNLTKEESKKVQDIALAVHKALGLRHYSKSDFIVSPRRGVYILETNTLPSLSEDSIFHTSLEAVGSTLPHFLDHVITLALNRR